MNICIICLGNRLLPTDSFGPCVFDYLQKQNIPQEIEVIEGGTAGLNILSLLEGRDRVVFVDAVAGFALTGEIVMLDLQKITESTKDYSFSHDINLAYALSIMPMVLTTIPTEIVLIGLEGKWNDHEIKKAAAMSLEFASRGCIESK